MLQCSMPRFPDLNMSHLSMWMLVVDVSPDYGAILVVELKLGGKQYLNALFTDGKQCKLYIYI